MYEELRADGSRRMVGGIRDISNQDRLRKRNDNDQIAADQGIATLTS
jgi:hypothetical protein